MNTDQLTREQFEEFVREGLSKWIIGTVNFDAVIFSVSLSAEGIFQNTDTNAQEELTQLAYKCLHLASTYWNNFLPFKFMMFKIDFMNIPEEDFDRIIVKLDLLTDNDKYFVVDVNLCNNYSSLLAKASAILDIDLIRDKCESCL